jgi:hypothetical protein
MKIGILGSGIVAQTLAAGFALHHHSVMLGTRDPAKLMAWLSENAGISAGSARDAAEFGETIVLAVKGLAAMDVLESAGADCIEGKPVIDATNPIADAPPDHGVLRFYTNLHESLMEQLQAAFPNAHFVKAFNSVGSHRMVNPEFADGRPTMFICGNDEGAKLTVTHILDQFGWETADMGTVEAARAIEPLCMLWCIPGILKNEWTHAFKLLRR